ncbi:uncharacterized protein METZ01_LOCUS472685, partial [marine metagenome]
MCPENSLSSVTADFPDKTTQIDCNHSHIYGPKRDQFLMSWFPQSVSVT